jgi:hypothetical protein
MHDRGRRGTKLDRLVHVRLGQICCESRRRRDNKTTERSWPRYLPRGFVGAPAERAALVYANETPFSDFSSSSCYRVICGRTS